MNCPQCQTPNQSDSAFCANCGAQLASAGAPASAGGYAPPPGQGTPVGYGSSGGGDAVGYGAPSGYGQAAPTGQYPPAGQYPPQGQYPPAGQYQPEGQYPPGGQYPPPGQYPPSGQQPGAGYQPAGGYQPSGGYQPQQRPAGTAVPPFQLDMKRLTRVDQIVGGASLIVLISLFLPWFSITVSGLGSESPDGTDFHGWLWLVFVLDLFILGYLAMRAGWEREPVRLPIAHAPLLIVATGLQLLLVLIAFFVMPGYGPGVSVGWAWGSIVGLLAALVAAGPVIWPAVQSYMQSRQQ